ncbi:MAG: bifunctional 5,10-methylenetetrahydrofolate dehydrogenase/5,10-methenyltetrahydrofolate cyclohydrolase [Candidatus Nomurabacteria bacterium]|jgi:methylenetetrahydrofolate dehydrogenase (NADP+)/methenyltetrahydrofolate cyclohydrolase|nr:bifunctional 5,10-methylenetetrahydrofolate dehydrogenase/5,10-methenyltetrahydrofolate cyclohydrolase [Candidatus Nomurabacteria bacterium]
MKWLDGRELADFIKERQAREVRRMRQTEKKAPVLLILKDSDNPVIEVYVRMKRRYAEDIGAVVAVRTVATGRLVEEIEKANADGGVQGMIVQLPILQPELTDEVCDQIAPEKDVDGLGSRAAYDSATATAVNYLLAGHGLDLAGKKIAILGYGKLVGRPLAKMWRASGYDVTVFRSKDKEWLDKALPQFDVVVSATGVAGILQPEMIKPHAVVVDAGTASENGVIVGDASQALVARNDVVITPAVGGVGPLTISALFDHLLRATIK